MTSHGSSRYGCSCAINPVRQQCPTHGYEERLAMLDFGNDAPEEPFVRPKLYGQEDIDALEQQVAALRAQVDAYLNDPSQPMADLREELDLVAASRDAVADDLAEARMLLGIVVPMLTAEQAQKWREKANGFRAEAAAARIRGDA